jgi:hypothetical protein
MVNDLKTFRKQFETLNIGLITTEKGGNACRN